MAAPEHNTRADQAAPLRKAPLLTLAIPTYNRAAKVERLLQRLVEVHSHAAWGDDVEVLVCDNASTDGTAKAVSGYTGMLPSLRYHCQSRNVGFDGNVMECYRGALGQFVWFHSDDDLPDLGSASKLLEALRQHEPYVLRFSFRQPAEATSGAFQFAEPVHVASDVSECIELAMRFPKVSTYVLKRISFDAATTEYHASTLGDGFSFVILALSILQHAGQPRLAVLSETLACCDADYRTLDWPPQIILNSYRQAQHPWVRDHNPKLAGQMRYRGYIHAIDLAYQVQLGHYRTSIPQAYINFGASLPYRLHYLIKRPKFIYRLWAIKRSVRDASYQPARW